MSVCSLIKAPLNCRLICLKMVWARLLTAYTNLVLLASEEALVSAAMLGRRVQPQVDDEKTAIQIRVIVQGPHGEFHWGDAAAQFVVGYYAKPLQTVVGLGDRENVQTGHDDKEEECVSTMVASPFYTHPGRCPSGQVIARGFGHAATDPSSSLAAALTSPGQQPSGHVVPRGFGHAATGNKSVFSYKNTKNLTKISSCNI